MPGGQQQQQQRVSGHVSLKQTAHLRAQSEVPAFLRSNINSGIRESLNSNFLPFHQRSNSENGANYVAYSPYALRRKEITRPFSPPMSKDAVEQSESNPPPRSFSPYRQYEQSITRHDYSSSNRCATTNGQGRQETTTTTMTTTTRPYSPYRTQDTNLDNGRSYSPYRRYDDRDGNSRTDRWGGVSRSLSPFASRDYSPWRRENVDPPNVIQPPPPPTSCDNSGRYSPFLQRFAQSSPQKPTAPQTYPHDIYGSPMISRKR